MQQTIRLAIVLSFSLAVQASTVREDRTLAEFRKYAAGKLSGITDARLDEIVKRIDLDEDGIVSDKEFAKRVQVFRAVMTGPEPWRTKLKKAQQVAAETGKPLLIYFRADWCAPCKQFEKELEPDEKLQQAFSGFVRLRIDISERAKDAEAFDVKAIPTFIVASPSGKEKARQAGASLPRLVSWLEESRKLVAEEVPRELKEAAPLKLRVLSYNIHHGAGVDGKLDLKRIANVILSAKPDIVALQEVDKNCERSKSVDQPAELARLTRMNVVFQKNIPLGVGEYGNAILTRFPINNQVNHKLPNIENGEQRGVLDVTLKVPSGSLRFLATHFDHRRKPDERIASARFVNKLVQKSATQPTLLAGDLNAVPDSETLKLLRKHWSPSTQKPSPTVPVAKPQRQIDYVLLAPASRWKTVSTKVLDEAVASDHRAILATLQLLPQAGESSVAGPPQSKATQANDKP